MRLKTTLPLAILLFALVVLKASISGSQAEKLDRSARPAIPKTWDDEALASLEVPLAEASASPVHISSDYYYRLSVRPIYKTYPVYALGKEPPGYMEWLKQQEPEVIFDHLKLKTESDWIKAGEIVFDAPIVAGPPVGNTIADVRDPQWYEKAGVPVTRQGIMPFYVYVVRNKGAVELGGFGCATCHTRVMPDGSVIRGAQGNFPVDRAFAPAFRRMGLEGGRRLERIFSPRRGYALTRMPGSSRCPWMRSSRCMKRFRPGS